MFCVVLGDIAAGEQVQGGAVVPEVQILAGTLGLCQRADGFFRLSHQGQVHLIIVWNPNHLTDILGHIVQ